MAAFASLWGCGQEATRPEYALVIHGGAGTILKSEMGSETEAQYMEALNRALDLGEEILKQGGSALDAVEASVRFMEDSPLFNAGKGAVFNQAGENEMDASVMDGATLAAGAVAAVKTIRNPVSAARKVMEASPHVLLGGEGAEAFAAGQGLEIVDPSYFFTQRRYDALLKSRQHGTVGAVALDRQGNLAAATSTGGKTGKMRGRIGDSPIIGAGTYADNASCAVSGTGDGEFFIRNVVAYDIAALVKYRHLPLEQACRQVIFDKLGGMNAGGGVIALGKNGSIAMVFNTEGMYRGYALPGGTREVKIYKD